MSKEWVKIFLNAFAKKKKKKEITTEKNHKEKYSRDMDKVE